jgi:folylpolyglutamate synthase/dihydropteroate synthase
VAEAISLAEDLWFPGDIIVVTGSFYTIGEAREVLGKRGVLSRLRE